MEGKTRYLTSMGELSKKDNALCFRNKEGIHHIPIEGLREIYCLNEISMNTKLLGYLGKNGVVLHLFGYYGNYCGSYYPPRKYISGKLTVKQVEAFQNNRLDYAQGIVDGTAENILENLKYYDRKGKSEIKKAIQEITVIRAQLMDQEDIRHLMFLEGQIWNIYYQTFSIILPDEFEMDKRTRRPPENPLNALISFGNSMLYTKTISQIYNTHLDQSVSFLHEPQDSRFSLSLDLSEAFKPVIVHKTIFDLVNHKQLNLQHFQKEVNYCLLNDEGRKIFLKAFDERLNTTFEHAKLGRKVSYQTAIKYDGYKLIKSIMENKPFKAFSMKDNQ